MRDVECSRSLRTCHIVNVKMVTRNVVTMVMVAIVASDTYYGNILYGNRGHYE